MKRVVAVSDSHGSSEMLLMILKQAFSECPVDTVVFLGDGCEEFDVLEPELRSKRIRVFSVRGNNDWGSEAPPEAVFTVNGLRFLACHGHTHYVKYDLGRLWFAAQEKEASVVLYGHTHVPHVDTVQGICMINPGAVCSVRRNVPCYAVVDVDESGAFFPQLKSL